MSRAFVNEDAGADRPDLPELPVSPGPNIVTPRGLAALHERIAQRQADLAALKSRPDETRLKAVVVIDPATHDLTEVAFGLCVTVADENGAETTYEITGEDEADATRHRIAPNSPLARALLGAQVGDVVTWKRPVGNLDLEILRIFPAAPPA